MRHDGGRIGHGLLSLLPEREGIGHKIFHQAPPYRTPPLPTKAIALSTANSYTEACAELWRSAMGKEFNGLVYTRTVGEVYPPNRGSTFIR